MTAGRSPLVPCHVSGTFLLSACRHKSWQLGRPTVWGRCGGHSRRTAGPASRDRPEDRAGPGLAGALNPGQPLYGAGGPDWLAPPRRARCGSASSRPPRSPRSTPPPESSSSSSLSPRPKAPSCRQPPARSGCCCGQVRVHGYVEPPLARLLTRPSADLFGGSASATRVLPGRAGGHSCDWGAGGR